jgi:hypothetical protein
LLYLAMSLSDVRYHPMLVTLHSDGLPTAPELELRASIPPVALSVSESLHLELRVLNGNQMNMDHMKSGI